MRHNRQRKIQKRKKPQPKNDGKIHRQSTPISIPIQKTTPQLIPHPQK